MNIRVVNIQKESNKSDKSNESALMQCIKITTLFKLDILLCSLLSNSVQQLRRKIKKN